ncbi:ABC transporter ATP-binding protein [Sphingomonas montanisoli]|uniref:ABC transporter ATP-binding protein n=1 Tax=Sphingomonas montanisoli TaxID=2606412 RepID=A0A5D9CDZ6_9SPHN|nr:ABC transporter ATP-binding protein [Sphingomonas montanisoli]TZG29433.1 ABC transporter ATP-binding protein [Sphingomonas montanisoli]
MVMVSIENLSVALGQRTVVQNVTAELRPGALIGVVGPNGAGKSTLVRAMLGLVPRSGGRVLLDGRDVAGLSPRDIARSIAYLPQGQILHWPLAVERLVALGRLPHLAPMSGMSAADRDVVADALARVDAGHLAGRIATELSGGERARVMLARALAVGAPGLVVDEPLASLDPGHQIDVMELLAREARGGAMVVAVLHDLTMAARYCDRVLLLDKGAIVADGTPAQVLDADRLSATYGISAMIDLNGAAPLVVPLRRI